MDAMPHVRIAYDMLTTEPLTNPSDAYCADAVMEAWDGRVFEGDPVRERTACLALCEIGLVWDRDRPYDFSLIAERFREMMPELGAADITVDTLRQVYETRIALLG